MAEENKDQGNKPNVNKALEFKNQKTQIKIEQSQSNALDRIDKKLGENLVHITKILDKVEKKLPKDGGIFGSLQKAMIKPKKDTYKTDDIDPREQVRVLKDIRGLLGTGNVENKEGNSISKLISGNLGLITVGVAAFGGKISKLAEDFLGTGNVISGAITGLTTFFRFRLGVILVSALAPLVNTILMKTMGMGKGMCCGSGGMGGVGKQTPGGKGWLSKFKNGMKGKGGKRALIAGGLLGTGLLIKSLFGDDEEDKNTENTEDGGIDTGDVVGNTILGGFTAAKMASRVKEFKASSVVSQLPDEKKTVQDLTKKVEGNRQERRKIERENAKIRKNLAKKAKNAVVKSAAKGVVSGGIKTAAKRIPLVGPLAGLVFGTMRALEGDFTGAGMEVASGAASLLDLVVPGLGLGTGLAIDAALASRDMGMWGDKNGLNAKGYKNNGIGLRPARFGKREKNDMTEPGVADKLLVKDGVNLNNLDLGTHHGSMDDKILSAFGKYTGSGYTPVITSARRSLEKNASLAESVQRSLHLQGKALDLRTNNIESSTGDKIKMELRRSLGDDYDVIQHGTGTNRHIHIEFDPRVQKFRNGGIVGGQAKVGDKVPAYVNAGEMIFNRSQQEKLFHMANGRGLDQKMSRIDIAAMNSKGNMTEMISFLENKFASILSNSIAQASENAYNKRPKTNSGTTSSVDFT